MQSRWETLAQEISAEFPVTPAPIQLLMADSNPSEDIAQELLKRFFGKSWAQLTIDDWINTASTAAIMATMPAEAFKYYLPSLLIIATHHSEYLDRSIEALLPPNAKRTPRGKWWATYFSSFTSQQRGLVKKYLGLVCEATSPDSEDGFLARKALEDVWK